MVEFAYKIAKNANISHTPFELNCRYYFYILFKENINTWSRSWTVDKLLLNLQKLISICRDNLFYAQEFQKQANLKDIKLKSYISNDKV